MEDHGRISLKILLRNDIRDESIFEVSSIFIFLFHWSLSMVINPLVDIRLISCYPIRKSCLKR